VRFRGWFPSLSLLLAWLGVFPALEASAEDEAPTASPAAAELLQSMREKGILSEEEYKDLYRRQAMWELKQREDSQIPGWVKTWTFGGDMRLRAERIDAGDLAVGKAIDPNQTPVDLVHGKAVGKRDRARLQLRLGAERRIGDNFLVGFRFATGSGTVFGADNKPAGIDVSRSVLADPRSMNTTFGDYFAPKPFFVDRAYIRLAPKAAPTFRMTFGKIPNPFVSKDFPDVLVWDNDIQTEGGSAEYSFNLYPEKARLDLRASYSLLDEIGAATLTQQGSLTPLPTGLPDTEARSPYMYGGQLGLTLDPKSWLRFGGRVSYYDLRDLGARFAAALQDLGNTGGAIENNPLRVTLSPTGPNATLFTNGSARGRVREMVYDGFTRLSFGSWGLVAFAQSTQMLQVIGGENHGYSLGLQLEAPFGTRLTFTYAHIQRNGTIALFTDSDFFDGFTNASGYSIALEHAITPQIAVRAAFFASNELSDSCQALQQKHLPVIFCDTAESDATLKLFRKQTLDRKRMQVDLRVTF
jgi:hypothetical protein